MSWIAIVHLVCTVAMAGIVVFVQVVHYPLMSRVGPERFIGYEAGHKFRTGLVVIPLMMCESFSAIWLAVDPSYAAVRGLTWVGLGLLVIIWLSTAVVQAPAHQRLSGGFDEAAHRRLVGTNWIRTVGWLVRVPIAVMLLVG